MIHLSAFRSTPDTTRSTDHQLDGTDELQAYAGHPCRKRSDGKATWPGRKQVYRSYTGGYLDHDIITTDDDQQSGQPLLQPVMRKGHLLAVSSPLAEVRRHAAGQLGQLPESQRTLETMPAYDVPIAEALQSLAKTVDRAFTTKGVT